jgi:hypothetical protein
MFEYLNEYSKILVTGSGRAGTTITGKMIAQDTGLRYVDEAAFGGVDVREFRLLIARYDNLVVQCPLLLKTIVDDPPPGVFVVMVRRNVEDIRKSFIRVLRVMGARPNPNATGSPLDAGAIAQERYEYWDSSPKEFPFLELDYDVIKDHPLYVPAEQRVEFGPKQTAVGRWSGAHGVQRPGGE